MKRDIDTGDVELKAKSDSIYFKRGESAQTFFKDEWKRPRVNFDELRDLSFCIVDSVYRIQKEPNPQYDHRSSADFATVELPRMDQDNSGTSSSEYIRKYRPNTEVAVVDLHGIDQEGHSVCAHVHGFEPYFYCECGPDITLPVLDSIKARLNSVANTASSQTPPFVTKIEFVTKRNIFGYNPYERFLKITTQLPKHVASFRKIIQDGMIPPSLFGLFKSPLTFESNVDFVIRFMSDLNITGVSWVTLPEGSYRCRSDPSKTTFSQIEIDCNYKSIQPHPPDGEWMQMPPFRIISFDIEVGGSPDHFPTVDNDPVIQICAYVSIQGAPAPMLSAAFVLNDCTPIIGTELFQFENEGDLLLSWQQFMRHIDPDIVTGYNIGNFDWPYLVGRAIQLNVTEFPHLGRYKNERSVAKAVTHQTKQLGKREGEEVDIPGVISLDMLIQIQNEYKLRSYTLNFVSSHFLKDQKEDVHFSIISKLQNGTPEDRHRLAIYCVKDAYLPMQLMNKLLTIVTDVELARVCRVPLAYLISRGQQIRVFSQILAKAQERDMIIPYIQSSKNEEQYKGAIVIEPYAGYYKTPIPTLDFNSLYPSIMIAHNLCYSTLVINPAQIKREDGSEVVTEVSPNNKRFVVRDEFEGVLPEILKGLLAARKATRAKIPLESDPLKKSVLNCRQLALKVSANSVYGFTGATVGTLPCLDISESVTAYGREMIELTKKTVQEKYCKENGYNDDAVVIYGDTDSVMVNFGHLSLAEAIERGKEAAELVTSKFVPPIRIEFEKAYMPYLLISKKHYAGYLHVSATPSPADHIDAKGIETVRRDNCRLAQNLLQKSLNLLLIDQKPEQAIQFVKSTISNLYDDRIDLSFLVISKGLSKTAENYKGKQAHVVLAEKMLKRDPGTAPRLGDRVPYVIICGEKSLGPTERAEDPLYVLTNGLQIDVSYYIQSQLKKPIERLFTPILGEKRVESLLEGEHTLKKRQASIAEREGSQDGQKKKQKGSLLGFVKVLKKCICGRSGVPDNALPLCSYCKNKVNDVFQEKMNIYRYLEEEHTKLWAMCQRCQSSLTTQNICTTADCPIFYRRKKVQMELEDCYKSLKRFDLLIPKAQSSK